MHGPLNTGPICFGVFSRDITAVQYRSKTDNPVRQVRLTVSVGSVTTNDAAVASVKRGNNVWHWLSRSDRPATGLTASVRKCTCISIVLMYLSPLLVLMQHRV